MMPTLNQKRRYIVFSMSEMVKESEMTRKINKVVDIFSGQYGSAKAGCRLVYFDGKTGILRVGVKETDMVKASIMLIEEIDGKKTSVKLPFVGATIKSAKKFIIKKGGDKNASITR